MLKYYECVKKDDLIYSCDMVRYRLELGSNSQSLCNLLNNHDTYKSDFLIKYSRSYDYFKYGHLWTLKNDSCSFVIGLDIQGSVDVGFIEFNPNKCMCDDSFVGLLADIKSLVVTSDLVRYDLAIDIPFDRCFCNLKKNKKMYSLLLDTSKTEYLGKRNKEGFVKLYDKKVESNLDYDLTRLEITLKDFSNYDNHIPSVYVLAKQRDLLLDATLNCTDKVLIQLLRDSDNFNYYYNSLGRKIRKKIEPYVADKVLSFDKTAIYSVYQVAKSFF